MANAFWRATCDSCQKFWSSRMHHDDHEEDRTQLVRERIPEQCPSCKEGTLVDLRLVPVD